MKISNFSIKRPIFTIVTMFLVIILGVVSFTKIPLKLIPDIDPPVGVVVTNYHGAGPEEVLDKVTKPLEQSLATLPGLKTMTSSSQEGANLIFMEFSWTTSIDDLQNDIYQRLEQVPLPDDVSKPRFLKFDPSQFPVIQFSLKADEDPEKLKQLADQLKQDLSKVDGVASVNMSGTTIKEIKIQLDQDKLKKYQLSQSDIVQAIRANNLTLPGDTVLTDGKELTTRVLSTLNFVELYDLVVTRNPFNGNQVTIGDVAKVQIADQDEQTITRMNQSPAVLLSVLQQSDANTAQVSNAFVKELNKQLDKKEYEHISSEVLFDQGDYIQLAIGNISNSLILGGLLAMIVLFFFLRNFKSPLIIGIAIPYSVIVTFVLMYFSNFTLNIMTLGGLALGVGMLVDNSIVVIENIYRHLSMGKEAKVAARDGAKEVGTAITASTLTTIAVFLPVIFVSGIVRELFTEFALTISFSLIASLFVALTVVPMLASRFLKAPKEDVEKKRQNSKPMLLLERMAKWSLRHRPTVLILALLLLIAGGFGLKTVGMQFLPDTDEGFFNVNVQLENGAAISETEKVIKKIEKVFEKETDVDTYVSLVGSSQEGAFSGSTHGNVAEMYVKMKELKKRDRSTLQFVDDVKRKVEKAAQKANKTAEVSFVTHSSAGSNPNTLTFSVRDSDTNRLHQAVAALSDTLIELKDVTELSTDLTDKIEEIQITIDREEALKHGFVPSQIATLVNDVTRGAHATQIVDKNSNVYSVYVEYDKNVTKNLKELKKLLIKKQDGSYIHLDEVSKIKIGDGPVDIKRFNQQDAVQFTLKYKTSTTLGDISKLVDEEIASLDLEEGTIVSFSGDRELLDSTVMDMLLALVLAVVFVYIVMAAQFESLKHPFVIMFTMPLTVIGVSIALTITRTPLSLMAIIGVIVLAGIVVNNAIVLVDYINQRKESGLGTYEAIIVSVKDRVRPILMTALTTILGLVPLALGIGEGTEMNQPLGISVIGGLISSTLLTLFVIPVIYSLFDKDTRHLKKVK